MALFKRMIPFYLLSLAVVAGVSLASSRCVDLFSEVMAMAEDSRPPVIVVDPGHGGEDGGAVSTTGVKESSLNLEISLRLRDTLSFLGYSVRMTRESDISIYSPEAISVSDKKVSDLKNRVRIVNDTPNAMLLSIHQNIFPEARYRGAQVFYNGSERNKDLAEKLQAVLCGDLDPANRRQAKKTPSVYLLNKVKQPAALIECGFLSNPEEERMLKSPEYQKKLAAAIAAGLTQAIDQTARS